MQNLESESVTNNVNSKPRNELIWLGFNVQVNDIFKENKMAYSRMTNPKQKNQSVYLNVVWNFISYATGDTLFLN